MAKFSVFTTLVQKGLFPDEYITKDVTASSYKVDDGGVLRFYVAGRMSDPVATFAFGVWAWVEEVPVEELVVEGLV